MTPMNKPLSERRPAKRYPAALVLVGGVLAFALMVTVLMLFRTRYCMVRIDIPDAARVSVLIDGEATKVDYVDGARAVVLVVPEGEHEVRVQTLNGEPLETPKSRYRFDREDQPVVIQAWYPQQLESP